MFIVRDFPCRDINLDLQFKTFLTVLRDFEVISVSTKGVNDEEN